MKKLMTTACLCVVTAVATVSFIAPAVFGQETKKAIVKGAELLKSSQEGRQLADFAQLDRMVLEELKSSQTPGAAFAIVQGDRVIYAKGYGIANIETGVPMTPDTIFRIGSITKMHTNAVLTMLAEEGKLKLDVPIGAYISGLSPRLSQTTAHQLMSHTAGLRFGEGVTHGPRDESALAAYVKTISDDDFFADPGIFSYSNIGVTVAGFLIEAITGKPYADVMSERLFRPLGMSRSTLRPTMAMTFPVSQSHVTWQEKVVVIRPFIENTKWGPAGMMFSSASDVARFGITFMNGGKIEGKQILPAAVISKMTSRATIARGAHSAVPGDYESANYGYGLLIRDFRGVQVVEHGGSLPGFTCFIRMVPQERFAVILLTNKSGQTQYDWLSQIADTAMESLLPLKPKPGQTAAGPMPITAEDVANWVGKYGQGRLAEAEAQQRLRGIEILSRDGKVFWRDAFEELEITKTSESTISILPNGANRRVTIDLVFDKKGRLEYVYRNMYALRRQ